MPNSHPLKTGDFVRFGYGASLVVARLSSAALASPRVTTLRAADTTVYVLELAPQMLQLEPPPPSTRDIAVETSLVFQPPPEQPREPLRERPRARPAQQRGPPPGQDRRRRPDGRIQAMERTLAGAQRAREDAERKLASEGEAREEAQLAQQRAEQNLAHEHGHLEVSPPPTVLGLRTRLQ